MDVLSYSSFGVGVFGIIIAFYQGFEKKKLKQYFHSQSWHIFSMVNITYGSMQIASKTYKEVNQDNLNPTIFEQLSKSEAFSLSLFLESIRLIFLTEPKFDLQTISSWAMQGKITKTQIPFFIQMMPNESQSIFSIIWTGITLRIQKRFIKSINPNQPKENCQDNSNNV